MATAYTSLLGLALPVTGELTGTWGTTVNDYITQYLDAAVAGAQVISGNQTAVTLSTTNGSSLVQAGGAGVTGSAQYSIIRCTGNPASLLTITAPTASKVYLIINATSTSQSVKIVASGPTTGVTVASGRAALVAWNGSDYALVATTDASSLSGTLAIANGGTGQTTATEAFDALAPTTTLGDTIYRGASDNLRLAGNTTTTKNFLSQTGTGSVSAAPAWSTVTKSDVGLSNVENTALSTWAGSTNLTTLGTVATGTWNASTIATNKGGTGLTSFTSTGVLYASSTSALTTTSSLTFDNTAKTLTVVSTNDSITPAEPLLDLYRNSISPVDGDWLGQTQFTGNDNLGGKQIYAAVRGYISDNSYNSHDGTLQLMVSRNGTLSWGISIGPTSVSIDPEISINGGLWVGRGPGTTTNNTRLGQSTFSINSTGTENTAIGASVLSLSTTGANNTGVGYQALSNTTSSSSTAVGSGAGYTNTSGVLTAFGYQALYGSNTGINLTAIGYQAGYGNTSGSNNVLVGYRAGYTNTTNSQLVAVGSFSGYTCNATSGGTFIGHAAGYSVSSGQANTAVGTNALYSTTTSDANTAVGRNALYTNTTGQYNIALGVDTLYSNTTGQHNVGIGSGSLFVYSALNGNTTGGYNVAIGPAAMVYNTTASYNTAVGGSALNSSNSSYNTAVGYGAADSVTSGERQTAIGSSALGSCSTGSYNVAVGFDALYFATTGSYNTAIGYESGKDITIGAKNTIIGRFSGNTATLDIRILSNYIVLSDGDGNARGFFTDSGAWQVGAVGGVYSNHVTVGKQANNFTQTFVSPYTTGSQNYGIDINYSGTPNGTGNDFLYCVDNAAVRAEIRSNGGLANYSANNVNISDRREKTNFAPARSYLDAICAIPVQTFNYLDQNLEEDPGLTLGVVAQDVQAVAPELVMESNWGTNDNPKMRLSIYQTDLQYALMKCIQELKAEVDSLKSQLNQNGV